MKKILIIIGIVAIVVGAPLINKLKNKDDGKEVSVAVVAEQEIKSSVLASGQFYHEVKADLKPEVIGKVVALHVEEGDQVKQGQLLLELDQKDMITQVEQKMATVKQQEIYIERQQLVVENLQRKLKRSHSMHSKKLLDDNAYEDAKHQLSVAKVDLESSRASLVQAKASLNQTKEQLSKTMVYSPIDGIVTSLDIKVGEVAIASAMSMAGSTLMTIADPKSLLTEVYVDEADIAELTVGQNADIFAISNPRQAIRGKVRFVASSAKAVPGRQGQSFAVRIAIDSQDSSFLRSGMSCRSEIFNSEVDNAASVPVQAIQYETDEDSKEESSFVFVINEGKADKRIITTGFSDDDFVEIKEGVKLGETVITGPYKTLSRLKADDLISVKADETDETQGKALAGPSSEKDVASD
jgi:HlyD family secretion protein